jgi:hypothetical protein
MNKKGAIELSIGTIVIIVLAMSMLILGLILVKNIFSGATYNVQQMNDKVKDEINKLFAEDKKAVMYLPPNNLIEVKQGSQFGVAFAIQSAKTQEYQWKASLADEDSKAKCGVDPTVAETWIITGKSGSTSIAAGDKYYDLVRFQIPETSVSDVSRCILRYKLTVTAGEQSTAFFTIPFDVQVK